MSMREVSAAIEDALIASVLCDPEEPGLSVDEILLVGARLGFLAGELRDAIDKLPPPDSDRYLPARHNVETELLWWTTADDLRSIGAFDIVAGEVRLAIRTHGQRAGVVPIETLLARAKAESVPSVDVRVAVAAHALAGKLKLESDSVRATAPSWFETLPSATLARNVAATNGIGRDKWTAQFRTVLAETREVLGTSRSRSPSDNTPPRPTSHGETPGYMQPEAVPPATPPAAVVAMAPGEPVPAAREEAPPRVFLSYSHDSDAHKEAVLQLAAALRTDWRVVSIVDQAELAPEEGWPRWMQRNIDTSDFVLIICTPEYKSRFEGRTEPGRGAGASFEGQLVNQAIYEANGRNERFVPLIFDGEPLDSVPKLLRGHTVFRWPNDARKLAHRLHRVPVVVLPELGPAPDLRSSRPGVAESAPTVQPIVPCHAASILASSAFRTIASPQRSVVIWPLPTQRPQVDRLKFIELVRAALPCHALAERAWFPDVRGAEPQRAMDGLVWRATPVGRSGLPDSVLAVGFDGSVALCSTMWEARVANLAWGSDGVDIGSCIDILIAAALFAAKVRKAIGVARSVQGMFELERIDGRAAVYGGPTKKEYAYLPGRRRVTQEVFDEHFDLPAEWSESSVRALLGQIIPKLEYLFGGVFDASYVQHRIAFALADAEP